MERKNTDVIVEVHKLPIIVPIKVGPPPIRPARIKELDSIKETVYQGTLNPFPKALFIIMIKNGRTIIVDVTSHLCIEISPTCEYATTFSK
ncbi:MAG: hypothetical protein WA364_23080 [Candidatus Nitrosopolaris sp.]